MANILLEAIKELKKLDEAFISPEQVEKLNTKLQSATFKIVTSNAYGEKIVNEYKIDEVKRDVQNKLRVYYSPTSQGSHDSELLITLIKNKNNKKDYSCKIGPIKSLRDFIRGKTENFYDLLDFWIDDQTILPPPEAVETSNDEIDWLKDNVTSIKARLPRRYKRSFEENFPGQPYTIDEDAWSFGFTMYFRQVDDMPETLRNIRNSEGNTVDLEHKRMHNTSYIWHLIKNYPQYFQFD